METARINLKSPGELSFQPTTPGRGVYNIRTSGVGRHIRNILDRRPSLDDPLFTFFLARESVSQISCP